MGIAARELPRLVIESVSPTIDGGRYPVKRLIGDELVVSADIYKDGHDLISARVLYLPPGESGWRETPLEYQYDHDRWYARFTLDVIGHFQFLVEAWPDPFRTWRSDLVKRLDAGQDVRDELLEGARLLRIATEKLHGEAERRIDAAAAQLADDALGTEQRLSVAFSEDVMRAIYGPLRATHKARSDAIYSVFVDREQAGFAAWYELFPRSLSEQPGKHGSFADVERRLPEIAALGFDVLYLAPIHPIGREKRKGRNNSKVCEPGDVGSPWAIGSIEGGHTAIHPELGTLSDFDQLVKTAAEFGIEVALDYALQCAPDHPWVREHPEWFYARPDGSIRYAENPPKKYQDIYPLNFWCEDREGLWNACKDVLSFWIEHGVRVFRVDNPHTKPFAFWEWAIDEIHAQHPDVIFLAEAFTRPKRMRGLAKLGFSQSYSYFTWKNSASELTEYLSELTQSEMVEYFRPNFFANTPDILHEYLQHGGRPAFRVRLMLAGTLSPIFGIYSGFELCENVPAREGSEEYLNSEKYQIRQRDFHARGNIKHDVARLNRIRREHPALQRLENLQFITCENPQILAYRKYAPNDELLIIVNLDPHHVQEAIVRVPIDELGIASDEPYAVVDLMNGGSYTWRGSANYVRLDPSERVGHLFRVTRQSP